MSEHRHKVAAADKLKKLATKMASFLTDKKSKLKKTKDSSDSDGVSTDVSCSSCQTDDRPHVITVAFNLSDRTSHNVELFAMLESDTPTEVFRRGQMFTVNLTFDRPFLSDDYQLYVFLAYGPSASVESGTLHALPVESTDTGDRDRWLSWITVIDGVNVSLNVFPPPTCQVGVWRYEFEAFRKDASPTVDPTGIKRRIFYVLFNPWIKQDEVHMADEHLRRECVLVDHGTVYAGHKCSIQARTWAYGQFDYVVLPTVALLLEHSALPHRLRGSAVLVARALSAVINGNDDAGLLDGNWDLSDHREGTTNPNAWTGSVGIFEKYLEKEGQSIVEYGQCLQFAGCLATACRALGLPCRVVTCYDAGKDVSKDLTIDYYYDRSSRRVNRNPGLMMDDIWNYHCWNEVWMTRADLKGDMDGWQVIDASPLGYLSDSLSQVGPAPVNAVREGEIEVKYDVDTVYLEVSADCCTYYEDAIAPGKFNLTWIGINQVGTLIVTEHNNEMEIITSHYKYDKSTAKGKHIFQKALDKKGLHPNFYSEGHVFSEPNDVNHFLRCNPQRWLTYGQPFQVQLTLSNKVRVSARTVDVKIQAFTMFYNGQTVDLIKETQTRSVLQPFQPSQTLSLIVNFADYRAKVKRSSYIKIVVFSFVCDTQQTFHTEYVLQFQFPELVVTELSPLRVDRESALTVSFRNAADETLTGARLRYEGPGLCRPNEESLPDIPAGHVMQRVVRVAPWRPGYCVFVCRLSSDQIPVVEGDRHILIGT